MVHYQFSRREREQCMPQTHAARTWSKLRRTLIVQRKRTRTTATSYHTMSSSSCITMPSACVSVGGLKCESTVVATWTTVASWTCSNLGRHGCIFLSCHQYSNDTTSFAHVLTYSFPSFPRRLFLTTLQVFGDDNINGDLILSLGDQIDSDAMHYHSYTVCGLLGSGSFAQVILAAPKSKGQKVAVKVVKALPECTQQSRVRRSLFTYSSYSCSPQPLPFNFFFFLLPFYHSFFFPFQMHCVRTLR